MGRWWASIPKNEWPDPRAVEEAIGHYWTENYGDRRQEIVFIGLKNQMDQDRLKNRLDNCLVENYLKSPGAFEKLEDPFPKWFESTG